MSAARSFHLTPGDAIRDVLELLDSLDGDSFEFSSLDSVLAPAKAALTEALELLGERP